MARRTPRPRPTTTHTLQAVRRHSLLCGHARWAASHHDRTVTTLTGLLRLTRKIRRCLTPACPPFQKPYRPEEEGRLALPKHEVGLEGIPVVGALRDAQPRGLPAISQALVPRRVAIAPRTVQPLLARDDALVARSLRDTARLPRLIEAHGRGIRARDGLQPDVGPEGLWVRRDGLSSEVLRARS